MIFSLSLCTFAESVESPTAPVQYQVTVNQPDKAMGTVNRVDNSDGTITLTVAPESGASFTKWVIDGDYEIVSGSLTDTTITIKAKADIKVNTEFKTAEPTTVAPEEPTTVPADASDDDNGSSTSPETGAPVASVAVTLAVALGAAFVAKKQLSK